jgi:hypothetical protein
MSVEDGVLRIRCKAQSVEHGAIRGQHRAQSKGSGAIRKSGKAPSVEHRVTGAGAELSGEPGAIRENHRKGAKCQSTERSVDRRGEPSNERGAIRERGRRRAREVEQSTT